MHLYLTNKEVLSDNHMKYMDVSNLIALIEAENTRRGKSITKENFRGLLAKTYSHVGSKVLLVRNQLNVGLSNSSTSIVKDIARNDNRPAPKLPKFAWVNFRADCTGPSFFK